MRTYNGTTVLVSIDGDNDVHITINPPLEEKRGEKLRTLLVEHMAFQKIIPSTAESIEAVIIGYLQSGTIDLTLIDPPTRSRSWEIKKGELPESIWKNKGEVK